MQRYTLLKILLEQYFTNKEIKNNIKYLVPFMFGYADEKSLDYTAVESVYELLLEVIHIVY